MSSPWCQPPGMFALGAPKLSPNETGPKIGKTYPPAESRAETSGATRTGPPGTCSSVVSGSGAVGRAGSSGGGSGRVPGRGGFPGRRDGDGLCGADDDLAPGRQAPVLGEKLHAQSDDAGLRPRRPGARAPGVLREHGQDAPVRQRRRRTRTAGDVVVESAQTLHRGRVRGRSRRAHAGSRARRRRHLRGGDLAVEEREHDHLGERLRRGGLAGLGRDLRLGATDPDDGAVVRVGERLHVRLEVRRPLELADRDGVLARDDDPDERGARSRRRGCEAAGRPRRAQSRGRGPRLRGRRDGSRRLRVARAVAVRLQGEPDRYDEQQDGEQAPQDALPEG